MIFRVLFFCLPCSNQFCCSFRVLTFQLFFENRKSNADNRKNYQQAQTTSFLLSMDRLDHTNLDFEQLAASCSPFVQDLVMYVITNMHEELEAFLKENCQGVDDEDLHKHRYWDMFQGKTHMFHCCNRLIRSNGVHAFFCSSRCSAVFF